MLLSVGTQSDTVGETDEIFVPSVYRDSFCRYRSVGRDSECKWDIHNYCGYNQVPSEDKVLPERFGQSVSCW